MKSEIKSFQNLSNLLCMISTHTFGIEFLIRRCKEDKKQAFIYARITVDGERAEISTKEKILASDWKPDDEIVKGKTTEVKEVNQHLDEVRHKIRSKYRMLCETESLVTAESVKQAYLGIHTLQKGHKLKELMTYYQQIWEEKIDFKNYKTTIEYVNRFLESKVPDKNTDRFPSKDIYLSQLSMEFITDLEYYIRHNPIKDHDPCKGNGVGKHIQRFKRILNWASDAKDGIGWIETNPCSKYSCPLKRNKRKKLTFEQLVVLEQKVFKDPALNYVKDLFLFSCYTGFAFVDVMALNPGHFEWDTDGTIWCKIYRAKTDELSPIPLLKAAARIINKHKDHPESISRGAIFPKITNQYVNRCLKIISAICEFQIDLTFHIARHTFAKTVALKNGIPLETVQIMMGHTKITTTQIYADVDEEKLLDDLSGFEDKLEQKRILVKERWKQNSSNQVVINANG